MKYIVKCSDCKREREVEEGIVMITCSCGNIIELKD